MGVETRKRSTLGSSQSRQSGLSRPAHWLDEAVFAAYGWKSDMSDEEILENLLALNLERANSNV